MTRRLLNLDRSLWSWEHIFEPLRFFMDEPESHRLKYLEPKTDFFKKHPSQIETNRDASCLS